jgi:hypothetical protein
MNELKKTFLFSALTILLFGCGANTSKKDDAIVAKTDSAVYVGITDLSSTKSIYALLCQDWSYKDDADEVDSSDGASDLDIPYRSFSFFSDSTVVKNPRGEIQFGKWIFNNADKTISIKYKDGKTEKYKIRAIGVNDMTLTKNGEDKEKILLIADGKQEQNYTDDPFYISNNYWRVKPRQPESDAAIKERLRQCIRFYVLYFKDNIKRDATSISFYGLPSCFAWYTGGISIVNEEKLKAAWMNIFYNQQQALNAREIMEKLISKQYNWDTTQTNWVRQITPVLQQMCDSLK